MVTRVEILKRRRVNDDVTDESRMTSREFPGRGQGHVTWLAWKISHRAWRQRSTSLKIFYDQRVKAAASHEEEENEEEEKEEEEEEEEEDDDDDDDDDRDKERY